uniref:Uncharacterized protein n=1 Tax=Panagrolaimus sp. ES5 TaxID=591445 RepID=A0AC34GKK9_9BILA
MSPKQSYRGDIWPGYLSIADLNTEARGAVSHGIIAFLICGVGTPTEAMWKLAFDPLKLEAYELKTKGFMLKHTKFYVEIEHGIFDNAVKILYRNPFFGIYNYFKLP